ncbi:hypothetical protein BU16DRAFT_610364 [Lophium mytilinum]|uniref:F-box domain-containing protein n=1 Tax=Lophium mytilinum TaxID=390894 RepID=A0A6A6QTK8_9PEZI|nr:hypothetical protein BU16DRAFT_610364 [Lophium mytilinum]
MASHEDRSPRGVVLFDEATSSNQILLNLEHVLPEELLILIMSSLDKKTLLSAARVSKRFGRIAQEPLFHTVDLHFGLQYIIPKARQLMRTLAYREDLRDKVKHLSFRIGNVWMNYQRGNHLLPRDAVSMIVDIVENLGWPVDDYGIEHILKGSKRALGPLLALLPSLESLSIRSERIDQSTVYDILFGSLQAAPDQIPAFSNLQALLIHQNYGLTSIIPSSNNEANLILSIPNLTRLDLSCIGFMELANIANTVPTKISNIKHLSIQTEKLVNLEGIRLLGKLLAHIGPLETFTFNDCMDTQSDCASSVWYSKLTEQLDASHESLERLTIKIHNRMDGWIPFKVYPITSLDHFTRLRNLDINAVALVGNPIRKRVMVLNWHSDSGVAMKTAGYGLLEKLPSSLETLVVRGTDYQLNTLWRGMKDEGIIQRRDDEPTGVEGCVYVVDGPHPKLANLRSIALYGPGTSIISKF